MGMFPGARLLILPLALVVIPAVAPAQESPPTTAGRAQVDIFRAIELGDLARVKTLLAQGVKIDAVDNFGYSPLHTASIEHQDAILLYLIDKGADLNLPDRKSGARLLHYVARLNQLAAAKAALAKGVPGPKAFEAGAKFLLARGYR